MKKVINLFFLVVLSINVLAQESSAPEMADVFRADGKIYVVIGVIVLIFIVLFSYLIFIDRKLKKLEDNT